MKRISVLTGAGISAESGLKTFREAGGLWEGHDVQKVATPEAWEEDPRMVLDFYNQRRRQLMEVQPNEAHRAIAELEEHYHVDVITQNVDDLHERGGSSNIVHLHGELLKVRSVDHPYLIYNWQKDLHLGDTCEKGSQLRPHIVWFGEAVPKLGTAANLVAAAEIILIVGTSMQVYPAAGLVGLAQQSTSIYYVDPRPSINYELSIQDNLEVISEKATIGVRQVVDRLLEL